MRIQNQPKARFLMKYIKVRHKFILSRLVFFPTCLLHVFLLFLSKLNVLMLFKAPRCGVTPALTNKVKPHTHKCISATALEETTEKQRKAVCAPLHPVYLASWRRSYFLQWLHHQLWFSRNTVLASMTTVTGRYPVHARLKRRECGNGGHSRSAGRSQATPWVAPLGSRLQSLWS